MKIKVILLVALFLSQTIQSQGWITEIVNNTGTPIGIKAKGIYGAEFLVSEPATSQRGPGGESGISIPPRSRHVVHNLKIPNLADLEQNISHDNQRGMLFFIHKITASMYDPVHNYQEGHEAPLLILRQRGNLISFVSYCGAIKSFNFLSETYSRDQIEMQSNKLDITIGEFIPDKATYSIEINELESPSFIRRRRSSYYAYAQGSLEVNFKRNNIDSSKVKADLGQKYPVARLVSFDKDSRPIAAHIEFDKVVTQLFMSKLLEKIMNLDLAKSIDLYPGISNGKSSIDLKIFINVTMAQVQEMVDYVNGLWFPQYEK